MGNQRCVCSRGTDNLILNKAARDEKLIFVYFACLFFFAGIYFFNGMISAVT